MKPNTNNLFLHPAQIKNLLENVGQSNPDEVIVVRCVRKTKASKPGGPDEGDLYDLHCTKKPPYTSKTGTGRDRREEDENNGVFTVYASNRRGENGTIGAWRRVNIDAVQKVVLHNGIEYEVIQS